MSLEAWGDENPDDAYEDSWRDAATEAGWLDPDDFSPGAIAILNERERQEGEEAWTPEHDDTHDQGQLAKAAAAYAQSAVLSDDFRERFGQAPQPMFWPWSSDWYKPKNPRADLVRAGALIATGIDRLKRAMKVDDQ